MIKNRKQVELRGRGRLRSFYTLGKEECIEAVQQAYADEGAIGQTVRHYYYKLLSAGLLKPGAQDSTSAYMWLSRILTDARENGDIPYHMIVDPGRRSFSGDYHHDSIDDYTRIMSGYGCTLDIWRGQKRRIEVWVEKDGLLDFVYDALKEYRIPVHAGKGYASVTVLHDAALMYQDNMLVFYCGDFDPSGLDIERNMREKLALDNAHPEIRRIALTHEDTLALPAASALDVKLGDKRTKGFLEKYGANQKAYEIEALPAHILRARIREAVEDEIDFTAWFRCLALENKIGQLSSKAMGEVKHRFLELVDDSGITREDNLYLDSPDATDE